MFCRICAGEGSRQVATSSYHTRSSTNLQEDCPNSKLLSSAVVGTEFLSTPTGALHVPADRVKIGQFHQNRVGGVADAENVYMPGYPREPTAVFCGWIEHVVADK